MKNGSKKKTQNGSLPRVKRVSKKESAKLEAGTKPTKSAKKKGESNGLSWRDFRISDKKLARLKKLKEYFDTLDEDTQVREFEKLSLNEMHFLLMTKLHEDQQKGIGRYEKRVRAV